jgi:hypothetical protein
VHPQATRAATDAGGHCGRELPKPSAGSGLAQGASLQVLLRGVNELEREQRGFSASPCAAATPCRWRSCLRSMPFALVVSVMAEKALPLPDENRCPVRATVDVNPAVVQGRLRPAKLSTRLSVSISSYYRRSASAQRRLEALSAISLG